MRERFRRASQEQKQEADANDVTPKWIFWTECGFCGPSDSGATRMKRIAQGFHLRTDAAGGGVLSALFTRSFRSQAPLPPTVEPDRGRSRKALFSESKQKVCGKHFFSHRSREKLTSNLGPIGAESRAKPCRQVQDPVRGIIRIAFWRRCAEPDGGGSLRLCSLRLRSGQAGRAGQASSHNPTKVAPLMRDEKRALHAAPLQMAHRL